MQRILALVDRFCAWIGPGFEHSHNLTLED